jgi:hypothetical protein
MPRWRRLHEIEAPRHAAQRILPCALAMTDAALQCRDATEAMVDDHAQHAENHHARDPAERDAVERVTDIHRAEHGGGEHREDHGDGRAMLVFDVGAPEPAEAVALTAQRICADLIHVLSPNCHQVCLFANLRSRSVERNQICPNYRYLAIKSRLNASNHQAQSNVPQPKAKKWRLLCAGEFLKLGIGLAGERHHARHAERMRL